jgi:TolB protein
LDRKGIIYLSGLFSAQRLGTSVPQAPEPYSAPEQTISSASDVYALASILYEMLAGILPAETPLPDLRKLNPDVPEFLARALPRALEPDPAERIANATELFLTICLAAQVEAQSVPEYIPAGDSPSAKLIESWNYLAPIVPPPSANKRALNHDKRRPSVVVWLGVVLVSVTVVGLLIWYFAGGQGQSPQALAALPTGAASLVPPTSLASPSSVSLTFPTSSPVPTISAPDGLGGRIVFTCTRGDLNQLCMVAPTGGAVSRVTADSSHEFYPTFSPDGGVLLFASNRGGHYNLYVKILAGDVLTQLTTDVGEVSSASFSPDSSQVAFSNSVDGKPSSLWLVDQDGKNPHLLYEGTGNIAGPVWAPNGKSIAFAMSNGPDSQAYEVYIMDLDTKNVVPVTKGTLSNTGGSVDWSPDGRFLLLFAGPNGDHNIYTFEIVSGTIKQLTNSGNNAAPSYSPDGRWIVFNSLRKDNIANIFIMRADGSDVRQLTDDKEPDWQPRWGR